MKTYLFIALFAISTFSSSCRRFEQEKVVTKAEPYKPVNLYPIERLPSYFNRVVVLPCFHPDQDSPILEYADEIFLQELNQERIFETIPISTMQMKSLFGQGRISSSGNLPENFLRVLEETTGANGAMIVDLTSFRPYRPMSIGVRAKLIDLKSGEFMWAIDETFDAGHASIQLSTAQFQERSQVRALSAKTTGSVLHSPRVFTKFVASTLYSTLPYR